MNNLIFYKIKYDKDDGMQKIIKNNNIIKTLL